MITRFWIVFAFGALVATAIAVGYFVRTKSNVEEKKEYVGFLSTFFSAYFFLFLIVSIFISDPGTIKALFLLFLAPLMLLYHRLYRFKWVEKNRYLNYALIGISVVSWGIIGGAFIIGMFFIDGM